MPTSQVAWLGVLAVVFFQLQLVLHLHVDHEPGHPAETSCEVCVKLEQSGNAPPADAPSTRLVLPAGNEPPTLAGTPPDQAADRYAARAPPRI